MPDPREPARGTSAEWRMACHRSRKTLKSAKNFNRLKGLMPRRSPVVVTGNPSWIPVRPLASLGETTFHAVEVREVGEVELPRREVRLVVVPVECVQWRARREPQAGLKFCARRYTCGIRPESSRTGAAPPLRIEEDGLPAGGTGFATSSRPPHRASGAIKSRTGNSRTSQMPLPFAALHHSS